MIWIIFGLIVYAFVLFRSIWVITHVQKNNFGKYTRQLLPITAKLSDEDLQNKDLKGKVIAFEISTIFLFFVFILASWLIPEFSWLILLVVLVLLLIRLMAIQKLARQIQDLH